VRRVPAATPWPAFADLFAGVTGAVLLLMLAAVVSQAQLAERYQQAHAELEAMRLERAALEAKLAQDLEALIAAGLVDLDHGVVAIQGSLLFQTGSAELSQEGADLLERAAPALASWASGGAIMVAGHTDDVPIASALYASNWELSTARATNVVTLLEALGLDGERLFAAGFGEHRPVAPNDAAEGRQENRRVELTRVSST